VRKREREKERKREREKERKREKQIHVRQIEAQQMSNRCPIDLINTHGNIREKMSTTAAANLLRS